MQEGTSIVAGRGNEKAPGGLKNPPGAKSHEAYQLSRRAKRNCRGSPALRTSEKPPRLRIDPSSLNCMFETFVPGLPNRGVLVA